jgi:CHAD domain-containing protein
VHHLMPLQIARIETHLQSEDSVEDRVHEFRKRTKETRALLRLVRSGLGSQFAIENVWYRDAAREFGQVREAAALVEALKKLRKHTRDRISRRGIRTVERALKHIKIDSRQLDSRLQNLLERLPDARARLERWPALPDRFSTIGDGFERTLRDGRRALDETMDDPTAENFHELRKRVKDHWYHAQLLRRLWPDFVQSYADVIEEASDALGDHHDLVVLHDRLMREPGVYGDEPALETTLSAIKKRRKQLEKKSIDSASHIYTEEPKRFRDRMGEYWRLARQ